MNIGSLVATLGVDTAGLTAAKAEMVSFQRSTIASVNKMNQGFQGFERSTITGINNMSQRFRTFGYLATAAITMPIVGGGKAMGKLAMDYETSMTKIIGLVGVAREEVEGWSEELLKMAPRVGKGPKELADALYFITSAGIRGSESMQVLEMSAKASAAGLGAVKNVADLVTSAMNAYGKEVLTAANATDILVATVREGKSEATALATTMGMVLPIASYMGVTFDQVGAAVAAMTRTGTSAATASMQLRQILNSLVKPAQQSEKALEGMGTSSAALRRTIREDGLLQALMDIRTLTNQYGEEVMSRVFPNIRALSGVLDIMGKNLEDNIAIFESLENSTGSLAKAFAEASQTMEFKYNSALSRIQVSMKSIGDHIAQTFLPIFEKIARTVERVADHFNSLTERQQKNRLMILAVVAALGPLSLIISVLGYSLSGLMVIMNGVTVAIRTMTLAMKANPILALGTLIAAAALQWLIYRSRVDTAKKAQYELNKELKRGSDYLKDINQIIKEAGAVDLMDMKQLEAIQSRYEAAVDAEKQLTIELAAEALKRIQNDEKIASLREKIASASNEHYKANLIAQLQARKEFITADLEAENKASQMRVRRLEASMKAINAKKKQYTEQEKIAENWLQAQKEVDAIFVSVAAGEVAISRKLTLLGETFDDTKAKISLYRGALEQLAETDVDLGDFRVQELQKALKAIDPEFNKYFQHLEKLYKEYSKPMKGTWEMPIPDFSKMATGFEEIFNNKRLSFIRETASAVKILGMNFNELAAALGNTKSAEDLLILMTRLQNDLDMNATKQELLGASFNSATANVNRYGNAITALMENFDTSNPVIQKAIEQLKELQKIAAQPLLLGEAMKKFESVLTSTFMVIDLKSKDAFKAMADAFSQALKRMLAEMAAKAVIFLILDLLSGGMGKLGSAAKGLLSGQTLGTFMLGKGMAEGGIVPQGYPNDTFHARLSTGEAVIPLKQLGSILPEKQQDTIVGDVTIKGRDLLLVLKRAINELNAVT